MRRQAARCVRIELLKSGLGVSAVHFGCHLEGAQFYQKRWGGVS